MSSKRGDYEIVGKPTPALSARDKVTGRAKYTDDLQLHNPLQILLLHSPHASANILKIETAEALKIPGVRAILVGKDFKHTFGVLPISKDEPVIARERVRYIGEAVAAVAAETMQIAKLALTKISVTYEVTPLVLTPEQGLQESEFLIHPELKKKNNLHKTVKQDFGDIKKGFEEATVVVEEKFEFPGITHGFTEPHATQVEVDGQGNFTVYTATQVPHYVHIALAEVLELPQHRIRVIKPHLGGGFGGKGDPFPHEMIAVKMAMVTGRNTRIVFNREQVFFSHHGRHPTKIQMKLGLHPDQGITGLEAKIQLDGGAYASFGVVTTYYNGVLLQGPYQLSNFAFQCDRVYTNKPMCGAMRGHGGVNPRYASEVLLDMACNQGGWDPAEIRLHCLHKENSLTPSQFRITSHGMHEGIQKAMEKSDWKRKYGKLPYGKGIGIACGFFISGSALQIHRNERPQSTVRITIDFDGAVTVFSGASDIGQGSDTIIAQIVAEVLGVSISMIKVISADTRLCPVDLGSYSSRVTFMAGNAARNAAICMRRILVAAAAKLAGVPEPVYEQPGETKNFFRQGGRKPDFEKPYLGPNPDYADGYILKNMKVRPENSPEENSFDYLQVVEKAIAGHGILQSVGNYHSPQLGGNFKGAGAGLSPSYSYTTFITEVTVDPETGFVRVDKVTCATDCGFELNPLAVQGQIEGSIHMGLGQALMEGLVFDGGAIQNASFLDYKILSPFEQPEIDIISLSSRDNEGPFGAKEVGEGPLAPIIPSLANAVFDAVGIRIFQLPITPDKVLAAISNLKDQRASL